MYVSAGVLVPVVTARDLLWCRDEAVIPWEHATPAGRGMDGAALQRLGAALKEHGTTALLVVRDGAIVHERYALPERLKPVAGILRYACASPPARRYGTASMAKAIVGGMALLVTHCDGHLGLDDPAWMYIPSWRHDPVRSGITVRHLATHSSGLDDATEPGKPSPSQAEVAWKKAYWRDPSARFGIALAEAPVIFPPGSALHYSNPGFSALAYSLAASRRDTPRADLRDLLRERVMEPLGIPPEAWSINYGAAAHEVDGLRLYELGGGSRYTARAVARLGQLILHRGEWQGRRIVEPACVDAAVSYAGTALPASWRELRHPAPALGWWTNANGAWPSLPRDALVGAGAGHQVVVVIPSLNLVAVRFGRPLGEARFGGDYWIALERELLRPLVRAVADA